jgi:hypothetical protein
MVPTFCLKGHFIGWEEDPPQSDWQDIQARHYEREFVRNGTILPAFCVRCGSRNINRCEHCKSLLWDDTDNRRPLYCGNCGKSLPWTECGLAAADTYTDETDAFTLAEKTQLKASYKELTRDTAATPLAASRVLKALEKAGPLVGKFLLGILKEIATGEAKKYLSF